jgi:hypothetical protein
LSESREGAETVVNSPRLLLHPPAACCDGQRFFPTSAPLIFFRHTPTTKTKTNPPHHRTPNPLASNSRPHSTSASLHLHPHVKSLKNIIKQHASLHVPQPQPLLSILLVLVDFYKKRRVESRERLHNAPCPCQLITILNPFVFYFYSNSVSLPSTVNATFDLSFLLVFVFMCSFAPSPHPHQNKATYEWRG